MTKFWKMHGLGNDYLYFDCFEEQLPDPEKVAVKLSDRHFSVGGDGIILILKSEIADARMRMFNADGSEGKMCGNGIRCVGKFLYEVKGIRKEELTVETLSGVKRLQLKTEKGTVVSVTVNMGKEILAPDEIPAMFGGDTVVDHPLLVGNDLFRVTCVSMGNPHCVIFGEDPTALPIGEIGPKIEDHPAFPEKTNVEFVQVVGENELKMRVWERGSGETYACGTGACASAVAAILNGFCRRDADILVHLKGGDLCVKVTDGGVFMTGPAEFAFVGETEL